jgi:hypothetical protein
MTGQFEILKFEYVLREIALKLSLKCKITLIKAFFLRIELLNLMIYKNKKKII